MKRLCSILLLSLVCVSGALRAEICSLDTVPAATLLLPFFDVDLADPQGRTTLMSIANAGDRATLARVTLWTDAGLPTFAFDVYLTGYDVQTLNLRDVLLGDLPVTADLGNDPGDTLSPRGAESQDASFPGCPGLLPLPPVPPQIKEFLRKAHLGQRTPLTDNLCLGLPVQGSVARGYATVDVVRRCSVLFPSDAGYFGPDGVAGHDNVLWGEFFYVDPGQEYAQGENLVRIESDPSRFRPGDRTFYGQYVNQTAADGREPLPTSWGARFLDGGVFDAGTDFIVWRQPPVKPEPFLCGRTPSWYPLQFSQYHLYDEQENPDAPSCFPIPLPCELALLPAAAGRYNTGSEEALVPFDFGWLFVDLRPSPQAWVGSVTSASRVFSVGLEATPFHSGCEPAFEQPW